MVAAVFASSGPDRSGAMRIPVVRRTRVVTVAIGHQQAQGLEKRSVGRQGELPERIPARVGPDRHVIGDRDRVDAEFLGAHRELDDRTRALGCRRPHTGSERVSRAGPDDMFERAPGRSRRGTKCALLYSSLDARRREQAWRSTRTPRMRVSLGLQSHAARHGTDGPGLVELARVAEEVGLDGVVIGDHVVLGNRLDRYPYPPVHFTHDASWMEPLSVLAAVAAVTTRIRLTTGVLVSPLRPAVLLAKTAATVDHLSGGRLELGVGVGWQPEEFAAVGADFAGRGRLLTDGIAACRRSGAGPASFRSSTTNFEDLWCNPKPTRPDGIPVLFSGSLGHRNLADRRVGNGWITHPGQPLDETAAAVASLVQRFEEHGRDPAPRRAPVAPDPPCTGRSAGLRSVVGVTGRPPRRRRHRPDDLVEQLHRPHDDAPERIATLGAAWIDARTDMSGVSRLAGRVALVTGAAQGVGRRVSRSRSRTKARPIAVVDRNRTAPSTRRECRARGVREAFACDVADRAEVDADVEPSSTSSADCRSS